MKRSYSILSILVCSMLLASCNLFIEDDDVVKNYGNVPQHEGDEYETVVHETGSGCDINYQLKRDVRHLDDRDMQYITYVAHDEIGALIEIHYADNTPEELLPVPGEVLMSGANDKFEWGCCHRLQRRDHENGYYSYIGTLCNIKEVYETLEINGTLTTDQEETYYVEAEPDEDEPAEGRTRAEEGSSTGYDNNTVEVSYLDNGFVLGLFPGISVSSGYGPVEAGFSMEREKNFVKVTLQASFSDFTLSNPIFKLTKTIERQSAIKAYGKLSGSASKTFHPVKGKPFTIGGLVIVFFVDIGLSASVGVEGSYEIATHTKEVCTYTVDLYNGTMTKDIRDVINEPWNFEGSIGFSLSIEAELMFGFGFYGKVFSVRFGPVLTFSLEAQVPHRSYPGVIDASREEGIEAGFSIGGKLKFVVDLTFDNLFGSAKNLQDVQARLDKASEMLDKQGDIYESMKDDKEVKKFVSGEDDEWGITIDIGPWKITPLCWSWTWYPTIDDNSFKLTKYWIDDERMGVRAEYKIKKEGMLVGLRGNESYVAAMRVMNGDEEVGRVYDEESRFAGPIKGRTLHFTLTDLDLKPGVQYKAEICYYSRNGASVDTSRPAATDKSLPFEVASPSVIVQSLTPIGFEENPDGIAKNGYMFVYLVKLDSRTLVEGSKAIDIWRLREQNSGFRFDKSNSRQSMDGTYVSHWKFIKRTNIPKMLQRIEYDIDILPTFYLDRNDESTKRQGNHYKAKIYSDGTYDIIDDGTGFGMSGLRYAPRRNAGAPSLKDQPVASPLEGEFEVILESVEGPDGTVVYERPGFSPSATTSSASQPRVALRRL